MQLLAKIRHHGMHAGELLLLGAYQYMHCEQCGAYVRNYGPHHKRCRSCQDEFRRAYYRLRARNKRGRWVKSLF